MAKPAATSNYFIEIKPPASVIFSLAGGCVWAGWPGSEAYVNLGKHEPVSEMMQDFLAQNALAERLAKTTGG